MTASTAIPAALDIAGPADARVPARGGATQLTFTGSRGAFLNLLLKGAVLLIPTFGFYRFWLTTRLRRHLWAHTRLGSESFEYTGTGKELLIGFLIALAILVPIWLIYFALITWAESLREFASLPLILVLYTLGQYGRYRARRYRASRTVFRGLRFWMTGSGWNYAARAVGLGLVSMLTLGLAGPWVLAALERYKMRHTRYGTLQGDFVATGWQLAKRAWHFWLLLVPLPVAMFATAVFATADADKETTAAVAGVTVVGIALLFVVLYPFVLAAYAGWHANGIRFGAVAVHSNLTNRAFFGTFLRLIGSSIALGLAFALIVGLISFAFSNQLQDLGQGRVTAGSITAAAVVAFGYLVLILGIGVLNRYFLARGLWAIVAGSITISNVAAIEEAVAAGEPDNAFGEGLADALDFGGGL